ncbi:MAG: hypothetical protein DWQ04_19210, partial [Chloroflexi bacterium]
MKGLSLSLLGQYQAFLNERPLINFRTQKMQALLAYLVVEKDRIHRRDTLMGLLWPDQLQKSAQVNLRQTLSLLRRAIPAQIDTSGTEFHLLISDRQIVQINPNYPLILDVEKFITFCTVGQQQKDAVKLEQAIELFRGDFLADFYLSDSNPFNVWAETQRERLRRLALDGMAALTAVYLSQNQLDQAEDLARRQLSIDNLREAAHRQLMMVLAENGRRHEALSQYDMLHKLLWDELGVAPEPATQSLLAQIEAGELAAQSAESIKPIPTKGERPVFLEMAALTPASDHDAFVARMGELEQLHGSLNQAVTGESRVIFVTGEAGQGKSALLQTFMKQAVKRHESLLVVDGTCSALIGTSDPYQPIRQWMTMLTGELESKWGLGAISSKWARRLWQAAPSVVDVILTHGPDLPGKLVPTGPIEKRLENQLSTNQNEIVSQPALFAQITAVLQTLAQQTPLLLVLDDMQWADSGTIGLLFHLGRQLRQSPVLLVCAYRPSDVAAGRTGERHPLASVVQELGRLYGETAVSLENADHHAFVEALVDSQPNQLNTRFRNNLYQRTSGHALFTVELLRGMRERGDLILDEKVQWTASDRMNWSSLPSKVEATVAERIDRLPDQLRELLKVACIEGEVFTAELLAQVQELPARKLVQSLSSQLDQQHRLVEVVGIDRLGGQRLSRYRFRHHLIFQYLQTQVDPVETVYLHEAVGEALEGLAGDETRTVAVQLAHHFEQAGLLQKAIDYQQMAGDEAQRLSVQEEAQTHFEHALTLLAKLPQSADRMDNLIVLQTAVLHPQIHKYGFSAPVVVDGLMNMQDVAANHVPTLFGLAMGAIWAGNGRFATKWSQQLNKAAAAANDAAGFVAAHAAAGELAFLQNDLVAAQASYQKAISCADRVERSVLISDYWQDIAAICEMRLALIAAFAGQRDVVRDTAVS